MNEELKKKMREILLERYGVDIDEAVPVFNTKLCVYFSRKAIYDPCEHVSQKDQGRDTQ